MPPVVVISCDPKSGEIFVPAIAAELCKSALRILPSVMPSDVTRVSVIYLASNTSILPIASCNAATSKGTSLA